MKGTMRILNHTGDLEQTWESENDEQVEQAEKKYQELVQKGYQAFALESGVATRMDYFDKEREEVILVPRLYGG